MKHFCSFSEAIRAGIPLGPQAFGYRGHGGSMCVLYTGYVAMELDWILGNASDIYPYLKDITKCPDCDLEAGIAPHDYTPSLLTHINDHHKWTREQIADWLYGYEESIGYVTLVESESSSESLQTVLSV